MAMPWQALAEIMVQIGAGDNTDHLVVVVVVVAAVAVISCAFVFSRYGNKPAAARRRLPPSPRRLPLVGNLHQLGALPHRSLAALAAAHGPDVMLLRLGQVPAVVVSSAAAAREVLQEKDHVFGSRPSLALPRALLYGCTDIAFAPDGAYWRRARKLSVLHLLGPARVQASRAVREEEAAALLRRVEEALACGGGGVVPLSELMSGYTKDVVGRLVLGTRASGGEGWRAKVDALMAESIALLGKTFHFRDYFPWLAWVSAAAGTDARMRRAFETTDGILEEIVAGASKEMENSNGDGGALVHALLSSLAGGGAQTQECITRDNVKAILADMFAAGTDATIIVMEWTMAELLRNKSALRRLQLELRQQPATPATATATATASTEDLPGMEYLRAVVKEALRLHPPTPLLVPRESMQPATIGDGHYDVPGKARVFVNVWAIARDPEAWDSPEEFRPERFLGGNGGGIGGGGGNDFFHSIPFGGGRRRCPGEQFGMSIVEVAVANLVRRFDWSPAPRELDMEEAPGFELRLKTPLHAFAVPWSSDH